MPEPDSRRTDSVTRWLACYLAPALLAAVALVQIGLAQPIGPLTPSRGGGFGMFSTVDKLANRMARAYLVSEKGEALLRTPASPPTVRLVRSALSYPGDRQLRAAARSLLAEYTRAEAHAVRLEVWKRSFDSRTARVRREKLRELRATRAELGLD